MGKDFMIQSFGLGSGPEKTIAPVQMEDFYGYALFGWVHLGRNVPATYKNLQ
jgi:cyclase